MPVTINGSTGISGVDGTAASPAVQGTDTNTGVYFTADTVYVATNGTHRANFGSTGNFAFDSGYGSVATAYGCRAWVNFNGTGTVAIRASGNVSSITDNGTGDYTVNFTTALADANYSFAVNGYQTNAANTCNAQPTGQTVTASALRVLTTNSSFSYVDSLGVSVAIFR